MAGMPEQYVALQQYLSQQPDFDNKLSETLDEIGVNDEMVQKRRRNELLHETLGTTATKLRGYDRPEYHFGSRSEGTTTLGLYSDIDRLYCVTGRNVVQSRTELKPDDKAKLNDLMVQGGDIAPGYCHLQVLTEEIQDPSIDVETVNDHYVRRPDGLIFYKNTVMQDFIPGQGERHGPSWAETSQMGFTDQDTVAAIHCRSWPYQARDWLNQSSLGGWPTNEMKMRCMSSGCFVVPTGSQPDRELEWRISTSVAERQLMFSLNITQLRCYVLMKMIMKTFMKEEQKNKISSFMCKCTLLHSIESSLPNEWQEKNLWHCLMKCLRRLQICIQDENCPHFIIPGNNLMAGKFSPKVKANLLDMMQYLISYNKLMLAKGIKIDNLSERLGKKLGMESDENCYMSPFQISCNIKALCLIDTAVVLRAKLNTYLKHMCMHTKSPERTEKFLQKSLETLEHLTSQGDVFAQEVYSLFAPLISTFLGSILASRFGINADNTKSKEALVLLNRGLDSDVSSGRLKLASIFFCTGNIERAQTILLETEAKYNLETVEPVCRCTHFRLYGEEMNLSKYQEARNEVVKNIVAFCVIYISNEMKCMPKELQYEMFSSTGEVDEDQGEATCTDWAVVDSLPYLYFLQYKLYGQLQKRDAQQQALLNMQRVIDSTPNLGHRETALNLLGQCMERENKVAAALQCYIRSLHLRQRNNAAKLHICMCLTNLIQQNKTFTTTLYETEPGCK